MSHESKLPQKTMQQPKLDEDVEKANFRGFKQQEGKYKRAAHSEQAN